MNRLYIGTYAPTTFDGLDKQIRLSFLAENGPGVLPSSRKNNLLKTCLVPCGTYETVGASMAWAYKEVAEHKLADVYLVLGGYQGKDILTNLFVDWSTPFGSINVHKELGKRLVHDAGVKNEYEPFLQDTIIERQLPFLQFACRDVLDKLSILPVLVGNSSSSTWQRLGEVVGDLAESHKITVICCASMDNSVAMHVAALDSEDAVQAAQRRQLDHPYVFGALIEIAKHLYCRRGTVLSSDQNGYSLVFS